MNIKARIDRLEKDGGAGFGVMLYSLRERQSDHGAEVTGVDLLRQGAVVGGVDRADGEAEAAMMKRATEAARRITGTATVALLHETVTRL